MNDRIHYDVTIALLSDAILGSGHTVPGGEDIALQRDERGYPYLRGSTLKGLLRESLENLAAWGDFDSSLLTAILGSSGRSWTSDHRRLTISDFYLVNPPELPELCCDKRTFTEIQDGIIQDGSLRVAACVLSGNRFRGTLQCASEDAEKIQDALKGIRHLGTMRSRGFGHVCITAEAKVVPPSAPVNGEGNWISYALFNKSGLVLTDFQHSTDDASASHGFIPGSAVRGMVLSHLAQADSAWFEAHRRPLLEEVRFLDALPTPNPQLYQPLPSPMGFYEDKQEQRLECIFPNGQCSPGFKRASMGTFCARKGEKLVYWNALTDGTVRIRRDVRSGKKQVFHTQYLKERQTFVGYIAVENPELRERIAQVLQQDIWLGADRYEGFGHCRVEKAMYCTAPAWVEPKEVQSVGNAFYLMVLSPLAMQNAFGEPCGIDEGQLAKMLGVEDLKIDLCAASLSEYTSFNRTLGSHLPLLRMYDRGSVFHIVCREAPTAEALYAMQLRGLGLRREEGAGMVLILAEDTLPAITKKEQYTPTQSQRNSQLRERHRAELQWLMAHKKALAPGKNMLSRSQLGTLQQVCSEALRLDRRLMVRNWLQDGEKNRDPEKAQKFGNARAFIDQVLGDPNSPAQNKTHLPAHITTWQQKLGLLIRLMDYTRKED